MFNILMSGRKIKKNIIEAILKKMIVRNCQYVICVVSYLYSVCDSCAGDVWTVPDGPRLSQSLLHKDQHARPQVGPSVSRLLCVLRQNRELYIHCKQKYTFKVFVCQYFVYIITCLPSMKSINPKYRYFCSQSVTVLISVLFS